MTHTAPETRGGFPDVRPVEDTPDELGPFGAALHRLQDLTVSTRPAPAHWAAVGGNQAVHGGMIPLLYDWLFGMVVTCADIHPTRTPINEPLTARGRISELDGRKVFIAATMTATDGTVLTEADGLMVRLLPHQP